MTDDERGEGTRFLEATQSDEPHDGLGLSIEQSATWSLESAEQGAAFAQASQPEEFYSRWGNPTVARFEEALAEVESGEAALATSSGMGAIATALIDQAREGERIVAQNSLYSATQEMMSRLLPDYGVDATFVPGPDVAAFEEAITEDTSLVYLETPSNPLLQIADIEAIADVAHDHGVPVFVDNTFASPVNQRPLELGADVVLHSGTKFLAGHSDVTAGGIVADGDTIESMWTTYKMLGPSLAPNDAFLVHRGMKTLHLRVRQQNRNARQLTAFLDQHPKVAEVYHPSLKTHEGHEVAARQMDDFGAILSFEVDGGVEAGRRALEATEVCTLGVSLGGVETLVQHPASMTHAPLSEAERREAGIADGLIRVSVGIEDPEDLQADLAEALAAV
jgi:methionine-gamma-lyase